MNKQLLLLLTITSLCGCASTPQSSNTKQSSATDSAVTIHFAGGDGSSVAKAIIIVGAKNEFEGIAAETAWAEQNLPGWAKQEQELIAQRGKSYDGITYSSSDGKERKVYFDISKFFGKLF